MSDEKFESAPKDFNIIITINGKKDVINNSNFEITDFDENINGSKAIDVFKGNGCFTTTLSDYCD